MALVGFRTDECRVLIRGQVEFGEYVNEVFQIPTDHPIIEQLRVLHHELLLAGMVASGDTAKGEIL